MIPKLTPQAVTYYQKNGYLLYHQQVFAPERLAGLTALFEEHLAQKGAKLSDELDTPHFLDPRLLEFLLAAEILNLVEPLIGPNIGLFSSHFISKDPYTGRSTPWHEDSAFWESHFDRYDKIVAIWLAIDRATKDNGCMAARLAHHSRRAAQHQPLPALRLHHALLRYRPPRQP